MRGHELEQHADDLIHHEAQALGAAPALPVLQQRLLSLGAAGRQHGLQPLRHRAPQLLLDAGMLVGELCQFGHERWLVEQLVGVLRLVEGEHVGHSDSEARGLCHGASHHAGRNKFTPRAARRGSKFPFRPASGYIFLFDIQRLSPYLRGSADLKRTACGRFTNAAKAVGARPVAKADGRADRLSASINRRFRIEAMRSTAQRVESVVTCVSKSILSRRSVLASVVLVGLLPTATFGADKPKTINIDWATYNPVSMLLKEKGLLEKEFAKDGIGIRWVQTLGSNKALEFLNAGSIDFGSTAGSAALVARINGNPIKSVYVYSRPEWTALVTSKDSKVAKVADLKGKRVAVTRGTDPHIFLVRALADAGLTEKDVRLVLLQHPDGRLALERGDVDAWAGLDPMMASAEIESGAVLFFRKPEANTWGILNVREEFAKKNPELVQRVLAAYEEARRWSLQNPQELKKIFADFTKLPAAVVDRQIDTRTELTHSTIGEPQRESILAAGLALQGAGVIPANVDVKATVEDLIDARYLSKATN